MNRALLYGVVCLILFAPIATSGQSLTTDVYPSEDELLEALIAGDIDYDEYILLLDLIQHGIDSTNRYLLDLIPGLMTVTDSADPGSLEPDQAEAFSPKESAKRSRLRYSYYRTIDSKEQFRYRIDSRVAITENLRGRMAVRRDLSGRERYVERSFEYHQNDGFIRRIQAGSIVARHGLGSVIGYRGKILRYNGELGEESFFYPDNGGYNGVALELQPRNWRIQGLASHLRDSTLGIATFALTIERAMPKFKPYVTVGGSHVRNRETHHRLDDFKMAGGLTTRYRHGSAAMEFCVQADAGRKAQAFLAEGTHRMHRSSITYAAWWYGDDFLDLTSGGKGADLSATTDLPWLDFALRSKRPGQHGLQIRSKVGLNRRTRLIGAIAAAQRNADSTNIQWLAGAERDMNTKWSMRVDYLQTDKERDDSVGENDRFTHRVRAETRFNTDRVKTRTYLAFSSTSSYGDYVSLFAGAKIKMSEMMRAELWSNLSRFSKGAIDYWYVYGRLSQQLADGLQLSAKLNHRYDRRSTVHHMSAATLELEASW